jgi:hypothetical protein
MDALDDDRAETARMRWGSCAAALGAAAVIGVVAAAIVPFSMPTPIYWQSALELIGGRPITDHHNVGYTLFIVLPLWAAGVRGVIVAQWLLYVVVVGLCWRLLARSNVAARFSLLGVLAISLHPYVWAGIKRIVDSNLAVFLLLTLIAVVSRPMRGRPFAWLWQGVLFGASLLVRPNFMFLAPLFFLVPRFKARWPTKSALAYAACVCMVGVFVAGGVNRAILGRFQLVDPYYSAYGLHNGNNPYSKKHFLHYLTGEYSTAEALEADHIDLAPLDKAERTRILLELSSSFILSHPLEYAELVFIRTGVFFAPDFRRTTTHGSLFTPFFYVAQVVMALPVLAWLFLQFRTRRTDVFKGLAAPVVAAFYVLPFSLLYADPRYRLPLDILLILDCTVLAAGVRMSGTALQRPPLAGIPAA